MKCRKTIVVLGCPRSGTSMIAGILRHLGIYMGEDIKDGKHEDKDILWQSLDNVKKTIDIRNQTQKVWGWKDPNCAKYIEKVLPQLINPIFIYIQREPKDAIESELNRNQQMTRQGTVNRNNNFEITYQHIASCHETLTIKYEDVVKKPKTHVLKIIKHIDEQVDTKQIEAATNFIQPGDYRSISPEFFVNTYFDNKPLPKLKKTITPGWTEQNLASHLSMIDIPSSVTTVLEVGCGIGRLLQPIAKMSNIDKCYGVDASVDMIREAHEYCQNPNIQFTKCTGDGTFEIPNPKVDMVFSWLVFQHIPSIKAVLRYCINMTRSVNAGGIVQCQVLTNDERPDNPLWTWHDPNIIHKTLYCNGCDSVNIKTLPQKRWTMIRGIKS